MNLSFFLFGWHAVWLLRELEGKRKKLNYEYYCYFSKKKSLNSVELMKMEEENGFYRTLSVDNVAQFPILEKVENYVRIV